VRRLLLLLLLPLGGTLAAQDQPAPAAPPAGASASATQQEAAPPTFAAGVEQVVVDVVVTDKKGNPVPGLTRDEMSVFEDGQPQEITSFDAVALPDEPGEKPPPPPEVSTNVGEASDRGRTFLIIFDDMHLTPFRARDAKAAVASFLENGVREGDRVTLVATSGAVWWTTRMEAGREKLIDSLKRLDGRRIPDMSPERMSDWEAMRIHMYRDPQVVASVMRRFQTYGVSGVLQQRQDNSNPLYGTVDDPFVNARASEVYYSATTRNRQTLDILERLLNGLAVGRGRKSVILVSEGFIYDPNLDEYKRVNDAARRANAAIYFVNARGLEGMPTGFGAEFGPAIPSQDVGLAFTSNLEEAAGSESLADNSGGFVVRNTNDLVSGIQRIAKETRVYYLLGYNSTNTARDGRFREIEVKLKDGKGLKVRARKGYYAPSDDPKAQRRRRQGVDRVIQEALDSPYELADLPLRMTHYIGSEVMLGKARVDLVAEVDLGALELERRDDRYVGGVDFLLVAAHRESGEFFRYDQEVNLKLLPGTRDRMLRTWLPIERWFELGPGTYQAKIVVRDKRTGRVGTVTHRFEVPDLGGFRVSTPVLTDRRDEEGVGAKEQILPVAHREFEPGEELFCRFEVYGADKDAEGMPQVDMGYVVKRADGSVLTAVPPSRIKPTSLGILTRAFRFGLQRARPGDYELVMIFYDHLAGKSLEVKEPFSVRGADAPERASARSRG
jgi:VWFA-related protein